MKIKCAAGITLLVKDVAVSADFYESLGFTIRLKEPDRATAYLNWFWIDLLPVKSESRQSFKADARSGQKGKGEFLCLSVHKVDAVYEELLAKGFEPAAEPMDSPQGNREFLVLDPDGYRLVTFKRKRSCNARRAYGFRKRSPGMVALLSCARLSRR